ncbi:MAG TPA: peptidoglycan-binding domain-containing protein [Candidatus Acidoferrales bacterium]|nr:peptidoglycan-binding domain-containing protein [Candidatus Acidoferrales bacterium]
MWLKATRRILLSVTTIAAAACLIPPHASAARTPVKTTPASHGRVKHRRVRYRRHHITLPKAPSKDRTEEIQTALGRGGYYNTEPNGKWDARSQEALRRFQEANGLPPTGKLDALSLQKLGLGSDVAGVSAPRQSTAANRLAPSSSSSSKSPGR